MQASQPTAADAALARAVVYRTLSIGFQPPTDARLEQIGARDRFPVVTAALECLECTATASSASPSLADTEALSASFWRLFGHTTRGLICACETEYGPDNGFHQPQQLADIAGYYLAFGLRPVLATDARADHIACECEFMDFLSRKQAHLVDRLELAARGASSAAFDGRCIPAGCVAPRSNTPGILGRRALPAGRLARLGATPDLHHVLPGADVSETLEVTALAERSFLRDHLGRFGRAFAARVAAEDGDGYFGTLGRLLLAFLDAECARVGVEAGPVDLIVRPADVDETPMACGTADELIQIQRRP